jgi:hypothetical protein
MTSLPLRVVSAAVRAWTRVYTCGVDAAVRDARRAEIESDVWEQINAEGGDTRSFDVAARLVLGIPADLRWRIDQANRRAVQFGVGLFAIISAVVLACVIFVVAVGQSVQPQPPARPVIRLERMRPPPPPPPPPPPFCNPPGIGRPSFSPCTPWP